MLSSKRVLAMASLLIVLVLASSLFSGCAKKETGLVFNYMLAADPPSLDPAYMQESESLQIGTEIYDGLVDYDPKTLETVPAMAESWEADKSGAVWTFHLKKGAKFHNGRECRAQDFVYSWSRVANKKTASEVAYHLEPIKGFEECQDGKAKVLKGLKAVDNYTLKVTLSYPYAEFVKTLGHPVFSPVPKEAVLKWKDKFSEHPVGTGPFKFVEWKHEQRVVVVKNSQYYGEPARLEKVVFKIFPDEDSAFLAFKAGSLDSTIIPVGQLKAIKKESKYKKHLVVRHILAVDYYGINLKASPWKGNPKLRQALNYLLDRRSICQTILEEGAAPATGFVPKGTPGFKGKAMSYTYNLKKAKQLLKEAGYPGGKGLPKLELAYNTGAGHEKALQVFQADAKKVGIDIEPVGYEWGAYIDKIQSGEVTFYRIGWSADYPTMDNFLFPNFYSENIGLDNTTLYDNSEVDGLLKDARKETDEAKQNQLYQKAEKIILDDAPVIPISFPNTLWVNQPWVKGYVRNSLDYAVLERVWLEGK